MNQSVYQIELNPGQFVTVKTTAGPVGAYHGVTRDKPRDWTYVDRNTTVVNGRTVTELHHIPLSWVRDCPH
jgi:hypothetical protein